MIRWSWDYFNFEDSEDDDDDGKEEDNETKLTIKAHGRLTTAYLRAVIRAKLNHLKRAWAMFRIRHIAIPIREQYRQVAPREQKGRRHRRRQGEDVDIGDNESKREDDNGFKGIMKSKEDYAFEEDLENKEHYGPEGSM